MEASPAEQKRKVEVTKVHRVARVNLRVAGKETDTESMRKSTEAPGASQFRNKGATKGRSSQPKTEPGRTLKA